MIPESIKFDRKLLRDRQGSQSVSIYYTKMKSLWDELASYHDLISCNCGGLKGLADREKKAKGDAVLNGTQRVFCYRVGFYPHDESSSRHTQSSCLGTSTRETN
ncbi:hypothetical protein ACOSQ3_006969 [Xanthoceras sorbifolium]